MTTYTVSAGQTKSGVTLNNKDTENVYGIALATTVISGGIESIYSGGVASGVTLNSGGEIVLFSGGSASNLTVSPSGIIDLYGISANAATINSSNQLLVFNNGTLVDTIGLTGNTSNLAFVTAPDGSGGTKVIAESAGLNLTFKGFNYTGDVNGTYETYNSLPTLVSTGANAAALVLDYGINVNTSTVYVDGNYTDSLTALGNTISAAVKNGLSVMVRPLIDFLNPAVIGTYSTAEWRTYYNPKNVAAFFASYQTMIVNEAKVAQANGATMLSIGAEIDQLTGPAYLNYWTTIIKAVRAVFSGQLTYSADWDSAISPWKWGGTGLPVGTGNLATQVSFWSQLDYVGVDVYAPLSDVANPTLAQLIAGWTQKPTDATTLAVTGGASLISYYENLATVTGKPLLFTELGYPNDTGAAKEPAYATKGVAAPALQALAYQAFFDAWSQAGHGALKGAYLWNWEPGGAGISTFSPQGLSAQKTLTSAFQAPNVISAGTSVIGMIEGYGDSIIISGTATNTTVNNKGGAYVFSGGVATGSVINSGGNQYIYGNGVGNNSKVNNGGVEYVYNGGVENAITVMNGGDVVIAPGGLINKVSLSVGAILDFSGVTANAASINSLNQLQVSNAAGTVVETISLAGNNSSLSFTVKADGTGGTDVIVNTQPAPVVSSVSYNAGTGQLSLTGTNFTTTTGSYVVNNFTLKGDAGVSYTLSNGSNIVATPTNSAVTIQLSSTDQLAVNGLLNKAGNQANDGSTYYLSANSGWDLNGNAISNLSMTVNNVTAPTLSAVTYDATKSLFTFSGAHLDNAGSKNGIALGNFTLTSGGNSYNFSLSNDTVSNLTANGFNVSLSTNDAIAVNNIINDNGNFNRNGLAYNLTVSNNWDSDSGASISKLGVTAGGVGVATLLAQGISGPGGVTVDSLGNVYVANTGGNSIMEIAAQTSAVTTLLSKGLNYPFDVAIDNHGNIFIAGGWGNNVQEIAASSHAVTTLVSGLNDVTGVAVDSSGNVYLADWGNNAIKEIAAATGAVTTLLNTPLKNSANIGSGIAVDSAGNVYVTATANNAIEKIAAGSHTMTVLLNTGLKNPSGIAVDSAGNLYIADNGNNAIKEIAASTHTVSTLLSTGLKAPNGVAVDSLGNLYIADSGNSSIKELAHSEYLFNTDPAASTPVMINNLWENTQQIELSQSVYKAFSAGSNISTANFSNAVAATSPTDYLYYNAATGGLYYDANGSSTPNAAVEIAIIGTSSHPAALSIGDFQLVA
jgi:autotransporter passenger strand-loop-strand repeat protein